MTQQARPTRTGALRRLWVVVVGIVRQRCPRCGRGRIFRRKALQAVKTFGALVDSALIEVEPRALQHCDGAQASPAARAALALGSLQQRVGTL